MKLARDPASARHVAAPGRRSATLAWLVASLACATLAMRASGASAQVHHHPIVGVWEWVSTEIAGQPSITPSTAGYTEQWEFGEDRLFRRYRDRRRQCESSYDVADILTEDERFVEILSIVGADSWVIAQLDATVLTLVDSFDVPGERRTLQRRGPIPAQVRTFGALKATHAR